MVATSQAPATLAGLEMLRRGGSAADAVLAAAACLCVAEPMSNGIGGDGFALVWDGSAVQALDAGGAAPTHVTDPTPRDVGPNAAVAPALVAGWAALNRRFGRLGFDECLAPAIDLAERGVPAGYHCSHAWRQGANAPTQWGPPPDVGEVFRIPDLGRTLRSIADRGPAALYAGEIAESIARASWLEVDDLARVEARWVTPLSVSYRNVDVYEMPPPTQGLAAAEGLALLERLGDATPARIATAVALALEDAGVHVRDGADVSGLLQDAWLDRRAHDEPRFGPELPGGTVYLCALDGDGMAVSFIQSLFGHFGSGVVVPKTGIVLNNRASCFAVSGEVEPGCRPYHTTIPGMLLEGGRLRGPFGVMGGFIQAQAHVQLVSHVVDEGMDPQTALDQPRFRLDPGAVCLEEGLWGRREEFERLGVRVVCDPDRLHFGGGQMIDVVNGRILGGSDPRKDGFAAGF